MKTIGSSATRGDTGRLMVLCTLLLSLAGCTSLMFPPMDISSSRGYYGTEAGPQGLEDSYHQAVRTFQVEFDVEDTLYAARQAGGFQGLQFDVQRDNMMTGYAHIVPEGSAVPCEPTQVYAVYAEKLQERRTKVTVLVDHLTSCASGVATSSNSTIANRLVSNINRVLSTF